MSRIFDALLRSEAEKSGADAAALTGATQLLEQAERDAVAQTAAQNRGSLPGGTVAGAFGVRTGEIAAVAALPQFQPLLPEETKGLTLPLAEAGKLVSVTDPHGPAAEAFRLLGVRLRHMRRERILKKVLITSTIPQEGKSLVAANLACTLAIESKQEVLLIEGDLRRPSLTKVFGLEGKPGISEWLRGKFPLTDCAHRFSDPNFWVLPAGASSGDFLELLQSDRVSSLMEESNDRFHWIIIDSPPVLPLADASIWSRQADGILLVTRRGKTEKKELNKGLEAIEPQKLIGAVLNSSSSSAHSDYYYSARKPGSSPELSVR